MLKFVHQVPDCVEVVNSVPQADEGESQKKAQDSAEVRHQKGSRSRIRKIVNYMTPTNDDKG